MVKIDDPDLNMNNALVGKFSYEDLSIHFVKHETPYITKYYVYNKQMDILTIMMKVNI